MTREEIEILDTFAEAFQEIEEILQDRSLTASEQVEEIAAVVAASDPDAEEE